MMGYLVLITIFTFIYIAVDKRREKRKKLEEDNKK